MKKAKTKMTFICQATVSITSKLPINFVQENLATIFVENSLNLNWLSDNGTQIKPCQHIDICDKIESETNIEKKYIVQIQMNAFNEKGIDNRSQRILSQNICTTKFNEKIDHVSGCHISVVPGTLSVIETK